jgi:hypothetical protein
LKILLCFLLKSKGVFLMSMIDHRNHGRIGCQGEKHGAWGMGHGTRRSEQSSVNSDQSVILNFLPVWSGGVSGPLSVLQSINPSVLSAAVLSIQLKGAQLPKGFPMNQQVVTIPLKQS